MNPNTEELITALTDSVYLERSMIAGTLSTGFHPSIVGFDRKLGSRGNTCRHFKLGCQCRAVREMRNELQHLISQGILKQGNKILELGSANGLMTMLFASVGLNAYGIEINEKLVRLAHEKLEELRSKGLMPENVYCKFGKGSYYLEDLVSEKEKKELVEGLGRQDPAVIFPFREGNPYQQLGINFGDLDVIYGFLWDEDEMNVWKLFAKHAKQNAKLLHLKVGRVNALDLMDLGLTTRYVELPAYSKTNLYLIEKRI